MSAATTAAGRADAWLFAAAPAERLAVLRILTGCFAVVYLLVRFPAFAALRDADAGRLDPVGALWLLDGPLPDGVLVGLLVVAVVAGTAFTAGAWFRISGPAFALTLLALTTYRSSWGQLLHFENLLVLHVLVVGLTRSADALSWDAHRRARGRRELEPSPAYGWPVRLAALTTVVTYLLAGLAKLRLGGLDWLLGDTLRNHVAYSAVRLEVLGGRPSPLADPLVDQAWLFPPLAVLTVVVELAAPVALLGGRIRDVWVVAAWMLHAGIAALMLVVFPYPLFLVAFAPFYRLEKVVYWVSGFLTRRQVLPSA
jgi:HTTM domain